MAGYEEIKMSSFSTTKEGKGHAIFSSGGEVDPGENTVKTINSDLEVNSHNEKNDLNDTEIVEDPCKRPDYMIYRINETPPIPFLIWFAIQQACLAIATPLSTTVIVAEAVCAQQDGLIKSKILTSTMFMVGLSTFAMTTFGVRLPIFQGPSPGYIIPLIILMSLDEFKCPETFEQTNLEDNTTTLMAVINNHTVIPMRDVATSKINAYAGSLIAVGLFHFLVGFTGLAYVLARYIGPITIVPVVTLFGIFIHKVVVSFAETYWPVSILTTTVCLILMIYLGDHSTPIPFWTWAKGFHVIWHPLHQIFGILISIIVGWCTSFVLTYYGVLSDDKTSGEYNARTDARIHIVSEVDWFNIPYPGQFGVPGFSLQAFVAFIISSLMSILDSIGDYNVCAKAVYVPPPPPYAMNRGIAVEGLMSVLSGSLGCGHATVSYGENIGAIGITKVASRSVLQLVGVIFIVLALFSKAGAFFLTIPYSVIGGLQIVTFGVFIGVILSLLHTINLNSGRNLTIIGISLLTGVMMPHWVEKNPNAIDTGYYEGDHIIKMILSNPSFVGGVVAFFMDNTVPGTARDRGIHIQLEELRGSDVETSAPTNEPDRPHRLYQHGMDIYTFPWLPSSFRKNRVLKYFPIFRRFS